MRPEREIRTSRREKKGTRAGNILLKHRHVEWLEVVNGRGIAVSRVNVYTYKYIYIRVCEGERDLSTTRAPARAGVREYRYGKCDGVAVVLGVVAHARGPGPKASKDITIKNNVPHKSV